MRCLLTWISDPQKENKQSKTMSVYSYTILMPGIFYHLKTVSDRNNCEMFFL
jgi:hypothetical protein